MYGKILRGGSKMSRVTVNPKAKCPKCGTFMTFVGKTRAWGNKYQCKKCGYKRFTKAVKPWQRVTEANIVGGNPMASRKQFKIGEHVKVAELGGGGYGTILRKFQARGPSGRLSTIYHVKLDSGKIEDLGSHMIDKMSRRNNPVRKRTRQMKVLGIPVMMVATIGGLVWWLTRKS